MDIEEFIKRIPKLIGRELTDEELKWIWDGYDKKDPYYIVSFTTSNLVRYPFRPKKAKDILELNREFWVLKAKPGKCPCGVCNHNKMGDCDSVECQCCSEQCT